MSKLRILMVAYACDPQGVGEHLLGWEWAAHVASRHQVELVTRTQNKNVGELAEQLGIKVHYVATPRLLALVSRIFGGLGSWIRIAAWGRRAEGRIGELIRQEPGYDVIHQTTFHSFRMPVVTRQLKVPFIWGPIAGGEYVPAGFGAYLGRARYLEFARRYLNELSLRLPSVQQALRTARFLIVSNRTTLNFLPEYCRDKATVLPANAISETTSSPERGGNDTGMLRLLYAGNCVARRGIPLLMEALTDPDLPAWYLTIAGTGPDLEFWKRYAEKKRLADRITFTGHVERSYLAKLYRETDLFVFPSLRDSGGSGLSESMLLKIPALVLDWGGPGEMVDEESGFKVKASNPAQAIEEIRRALIVCSEAPERAVEMGQRAEKRALTFFGWSRKMEIIDDLYLQAGKREV